MIVNYAYITNKGTYRNCNEDSLLIGDKIIHNESMDEVEESSSSSIFAISDGMGGLSKGEVASKKVLEFLHNKYQSLKKENDIKNIIDSIQINMFNLSKTKYKDFIMGATLTGIKLTEKEAFIFNVGDSRIYKIINGYLEKITKDHSLVQRMVDAGVITEEEMATQPNKNIVTSAFLTNQQTIKEISSQKISLNDNNLYLLVSDGIWETLSLDELEHCLDKDLKKSVDNIFKLAMKKKCRDNISAILLSIKK